MGDRQELIEQLLGGRYGGLKAYAALLVSEEDTERLVDDSIVRALARGRRPAGLDDAETVVRRMMQVLATGRWRRSAKAGEAREGSKDATKEGEVEKIKAKYFSSN